MRLRASLRWLLAAAALLALALVLGADALLRAVLESELRQRLGSAVSLGGISTELLGSPPRVTLRDLVIGPPGRPLLSLGTLGVEASSLAALRDGRLDALHLRALRLRLARGADGQIEMPPLVAGEGSASGGALSLPAILIEDLLIELDPSLGLAGQLTVAAAHCTRLEPGGESACALEAGLSLSAPLVAEARFEAHALAGPGLDGAALSLREAELRASGSAAGRRFEATRLTFARLAVSSAGGLEAHELRAEGQLPDEAGGALSLALVVPAAGLKGDAWQLPELGLALERRGELPLRLALGLAGVSRSPAAVSASWARLELAAEMAGGVASLDAEGALSVDLGLTRLDAPALQLVASAPLGRGPQGWGRLDGRAGLELLRAGPRVHLQFAGRFGDSPITLRLQAAPSEWPPLAVRGRIERLDADRYLPAADGDAASSRPDWRSLPLALDLSAGWLRYGGAELREASLSYRPQPPTDAPSRSAARD